MMSNLAKESAMARIKALLDENSFVELGGLVTARNTDFNLQSKASESDGVITGYGVIDNSLVYVYSQDAAVLGGTVGEMHAKKISRLYDMAVKMGAPIIALVDCAGLRLEEAADALNAFGEIYAKQVQASGVIPQITAVFGTCGGGMGISAALSDFTFVAEEGRIFVNAPNTLDGNRVDKCDTASAKYQAEHGVADFTGTEEETIAGVRQLVSVLPLNFDDFAEGECSDDLNRVCEGLENCVGDTVLALSNIADSGVFLEVKKDYAKEMVTGFMKLNGITVGAVANRTVVYDEEMKAAEEFADVLTTAGCEKAAKFVNFCDAFNIPVLTLTNATGFAATVEEEKGIAKAAAKLTYAYANATVPKINVVIGSAMGNAYNVMNSKACNADIVYAWPDAQIGTMDADAAVRIIYAEEIKKAEDSVALINEKKAEYQKLTQSAAAAAKRGYVDSIVKPEDTRKYVIAAFEMLYTKKEECPAKKHGTV
jgi:acetyl-CoA carboxylase carboxyltransferase component